MRVAAAALILALPATAAEHELETFQPVLTQCYEAAATPDAKRACIGKMWDACQTTPDGGTTIGMSFCALAERDVWDGYLNAEYRATMDAMRRMDAADGPEFATRADFLRDAQRAWIAFRDAECGLAYAIWGSGSMRQIAGAACLRDLTAERTIELIEIRETMR